MKSSLAWIMLVGATLALTGCSGQNGAGKSPEAQKPHIALIMKSLANEFFKTMEDGARAHQAEHADRYELLTQGIKDELDVNRQVALVDQMVAQQVDAIVIAPADSKALVPVCKRAMDQGVVVVNIDNKFDENVLQEIGVNIPFVGPDNRKGAYAVGAYLAKQLQPGDPVAIIEGAPNAFNAIQRKLGFEDAMNEAGMKIVASQTGNWEMAKANQVVSALLTEHSELKAILCANDNMALGAVAALRAAGNLDSVKVVGFDNITAMHELLKAGDVLATADQHADQLAAFGIEHALSILQTGQAPADKETPVHLITSEDVQ